MTLIQPSTSRGGLPLRWSVLAAALFLIGSNGFIIAGVLPEIARDLRVPTTGVGYTITVYALLVAILSPVIGVALPRLSRTTLMVVGLAAFVVGVVIAAAAPGFLAFTIGRVLAAVGGAAVVPTATAAGAAITPPAQRGRAIAVVGIGFTLATAVGAPLGTAIAAVSSWRVSMLIVAGLAVIVLPVLGLVVRQVPLGHPLSVAQRVLVLRDLRILAPLGATLLVTAGFNLVYIFSSATTGYTGGALATLLLVYGIAGIVGNAVGGPLTDRFGNRAVGAAVMAVGVLALIAIALVGHRFPGLAVAFAAWGVAAFATTIPLQHRLLHVDADVAAVAISWFSTALYLGIAIAPLAGAAALGTGDPALVPVVAAVLTVIGLALFLGGYRGRITRRAAAA